MTLQTKLDSIRAALDVNLVGVDIDSVVEQGKALAQLIGLSAECKAEARKNLEQARLKAIIDHQHFGSASIILKVADADCADEIRDFEYADRLNAGITHQLDYYRSVISLHKTELENAMK